MRFLALCLLALQQTALGFCPQSAECIRSGNSALGMSSIAGNAFEQKRTLYHILGSHPGDSRQQLKQNYLRLAKLCHPDVLRLQQSPSPHMELDFREIAAAWRVLSDHKERKRYDRKIAAEEMSENLFGWIDGIAESFFGRGSAQESKRAGQRPHYSQVDRTSPSPRYTTAVSKEIPQPFHTASAARTREGSRQDMHRQQASSRPSNHFFSSSVSYPNRTSSHERRHNTASTAARHSGGRTLPCTGRRSYASYILTKEEHTYDQYIEAIQQQNYQLR